eukprot:TRINITY_DN6125_c0_g3_i1.p1 TRINITY_DN6125_c0_g3~~TRINITY_DN6125_c0_g3_i1.p1  ORF type:complete len:432 (+),score=107.63 TRINITY_DN6125_c0_g3_i1:726-2021(+)
MEFKRGIKKDFNKLQMVIQAYAIIQSDKRFVVFHQDKKGTRRNILQTPGGNADMKNNIASIFGARFLHNLDPINGNTSECQIVGHVSRVENGCGQSSSQFQYLYFNKRPVDMPKIARFINQLYRKNLSGKLFPAFFISIEIPTETLDVNVQPDKRQVFLHQEQMVVEELQNLLLSVWSGGKRRLSSQILAGGLLLEEDDGGGGGVGGGGGGNAGGGSGGSGGSAGGGSGGGGGASDTSWGISTFDLLSQSVLDSPLASTSPTLPSPGPLPLTKPSGSKKKLQKGSKFFSTINGDGPEKYCHGQEMQEMIMDEKFITTIDTMCQTRTSFADSEDIPTVTGRKRKEGPSFPIGNPGKRQKTSQPLRASFDPSSSADESDELSEYEFLPREKAKNHSVLTNQLYSSDLDADHNPTTSKSRVVYSDAVNINFSCS